MRQRLILIGLMGLLGLNVALVIGLLLFKGHPPATAPAAPATAGPAPAANTNKLRVVVRKQFFSWQELESPDYVVYINRLREIGCPEQTIHDIIIADVNQLYAKRRDSEITTPEQQWWRSEPDSNVVQTANVKLKALDQERRSLLATLLGSNWELTDSSQMARAHVVLNGAILGDLPADTKLAVQAISVHADERIADYENAQARAGQNADPAELARLRQHSYDELAKILAPAQLEEYLLRYSQTADDMRQDLYGFAVTPDEFRNIFRARFPVDSQLQQYAADDPRSEDQRTALETKLEEAIKTVLGPDRYQQYHLTQDPAWQNALVSVQEADAPPETVQSVYALNQAANKEIDRIRSDPSLTPQQQAAQIRAVMAQLQAASNQVLGVANPSPQFPPLPPGLTIPAQQTEAAAPTEPAISAIHPYNPGETIDQIAAQYNISADALRNANPALDLSHLSKGTQINIPLRQQ